MHYNLCIIQPQGYIHSAAFSELAEVVGYALGDLGHSVAVNINETFNDAKNILVGCHLLAPSFIDQVPKSSIILNTEQLGDNPSGWNEIIFRWVSHFETWDYTTSHLNRLREAGAINPKLLKIGFHQKLARIPKADVQDIDVLFYGIVNPRRQHIIDALKATGLHVEVVSDVYGRARDALIARSKVILNMHQRESKVFEIIRVFYLMTNSKAVVSEIGDTTSIDPDYIDGVFASDYGKLVENCRLLVSDSALRSQFEERSLATIKLLPQDKLLLPLLV